MLITCGVSVQGESHRIKDIVCQDWNKIYVNDGIIIAAVADGLSSSFHSDMASKVASELSVAYCSERITKNSLEEEILLVIKQSFEYAQIHIEQKARMLEYELDECDTTLCLVVLLEGVLYCGQAGDSGVIALRDDGFFERVTNIVDDDDGYVDPLYRSEKWIFLKYKHKARSLVLVTDGIWNMLVPCLLRNEKYPLDNELLNYFLNNMALENLNKEQINEWLQNTIEDILPDHVNHDDKTMIIIIDTEIVVHEQDEEYYKWPSKDLLNELSKAYEDELYNYRLQIRNGDKESVDNSDQESEKKNQKNGLGIKRFIIKRAKGL